MKIGTEQKLWHILSVVLQVYSDSTKISERISQFEIISHFDKRFRDKIRICELIRKFIRIRMGKAGRVQGEGLHIVMYPRAKQRQQPWSVCDLTYDIICPKYFGSFWFYHDMTRHWHDDFGASLSHFKCAVILQGD